MLNKEVLDQYCQLILHDGPQHGCGLTGERHKWADCPAKGFYQRLARKQQHILKSNGLAIGIWIKDVNMDGSTEKEIHSEGN